MLKLLFRSIIIFFILISFVSAHGKEKQTIVNKTVIKEDSVKDKAGIETISEKEKIMHHDDVKEPMEENFPDHHNENMVKNMAVHHDNVKERIHEIVSFKDFSLNELPTIHPLAVHIPVMLIPISFILFAAGFILKNKTLKNTSLCFAITAFLSAFIIINFIHPHTEKLGEEAQKTLLKHDLFALSSLVLSGISGLFLLVGAITGFKSRSIEYIIIIFLLLGCVSIAATGHYGGTLVYVHGVGPMGNYLQH